jgi:hydrogenase expression/formation protein HypE
VEAHPTMAILKTEIGGSRVLDLPFVEQLPRIC